MITRKISVQLRAFCAAGYALFLSCTPETPVDSTCIGGECTAIIKPIQQTNSFSFDIDENNPKIQYFTVEVHATPTSRQWRYNGIPQVSALWSGNLTYYVRNSYGFDEVESANRETYGSLQGDKMVITQIIGVDPSLSGKTLNLQVKVVWDAGEHTVVKNFFQNFSLK